MKRLAYRSAATALLLVVVVGPAFGQVNWAGAGDGSSWSDPANWNPAGVPGGADSVTIGIPASVVIDVQATVGSLNLSGLDVFVDAAKPLTVNGALDQSSPSSELTGAATITIVGVYEWTAGTHSGSGLTVATGGIRFVGGPGNTKILDGRKLVVPNGQSAVVSETSNTFLGNGAVLEIEPEATLDVQTEADILLLSGSVTEPAIQNAGVFKKTGGGLETWVEVDVVNSGTIEVSDGELRLLGDLTDAGGTYRPLTENVTLNFASIDNEIVFGPSSRLEGDGTIQFSGDGKTVTIEGTIDAARFHVSGGNGQATVTVASTANVVRIGSELLTVDLRGNLVALFTDPIISQSVELGLFSSMTLNSALTATESWHQHSGGLLRTDFPVTVNGLATWQGGWLEGEGSIRFNQGVELTENISGGARNVKSLNGFGMFIPSGQSAVVTGRGGVRLGNGAVLDIASGATLDVQAGRTGFDRLPLPGSPPDPVIRNAGTFRKSGGSFDASVTVPLENSGTVEGLDGQFTLPDVTDDGGTYRATTENAVLRFAPFEHEFVFGPSSRLEGEGTIRFIGQGNTVTIEGTVDAARFEVLVSSRDVAATTVKVAATANVLRIGSESLKVAFRGNLVTLFTDPIVSKSVELGEVSEITLNSPLTVTESWLQHHAPNTLRTDFPVTVDGAATWQGGALEGGGSIQFNQGVEFAGDSSATDTKTLDGFSLIIPSGQSGVVTGTASTLLGNGAVLEIESGATMDVQTEADFLRLPGSVTEPVIRNAGVFEKSGGGLTTSVEVDFENNGVVGVFDGELVFGSSLANNASGVISGTAILGIGGATFTNGGTVTPGDGAPGTLVIQGDYVNAPGALSILMEGPSASRLDVRGNATLGGDLEMISPGGELPEGSSYQILTASVVSGTFDAVDGPLLFGSAPDVLYAPTEVVVDIVPVANRPPDPWPDLAFTFRDTPVTIDAVWNDNDPDRDSLEVVSAANGANGSTAIVDNQIVYTPAPGVLGRDEFAYVVSDPDGEQAAVVTVEVVDPAISLFTSAGPEEPGDSLGVIRQRPVTIDFELLAGLTASETGQVAIPLFDDVLTVMSRRWTENWPDASVSWIGRSEHEGEYIILEIDLERQTLYAKGLGGNQLVRIEELANGLHMLREMDPAAFPVSVDDTGIGELSDVDDFPILEVTEQMFVPDDTVSGKRATSVVDIIVLYTPQAQNAAGSARSIIRQIRTEVNLTNLTFDAGLLDVRLRLVAVALVPFDETGSMSDVLDRLVAYGNGRVRGRRSALRRLRARYGGDIVGLIVSRPGGGKAGAVIDPEANEAFFVSEDFAAFGGNLTFTHEMGHLFGAEHDDEVNPNFTGSDNGWVNPPKFWTATGDLLTANGSTVPSGPNQWRTIMAYNEHCDEQNAIIGLSSDDVPWCVRVPRWSDPNDKWSNAAGGPFRPLGEPKPFGADNNDRIRRFAPTVAGWVSPAAVISGRVIDAQTGLPVPSVLMQNDSEFGLGDGTDANGFYEIVAPRSGTVTITPVLADYIFVPESQSFSSPSTTTFDFAAHRLYDVTGTVTEDTTGLEGVEIRTAVRAGLTPPEIAFSEVDTTDVNGEYSLTLPYGWGGTFKPVIRSHDFLPPRQDVALIESDSTFDFTASLKTYTISAKLRDLNTQAPISDAGIYPSGPVDANGFFSRELQHGDSVLMVPRLVGYNFAPFRVEFERAVSDVHQDFDGFPGGIARSDWPKVSGNSGNTGLLEAPTSSGSVRWSAPTKRPTSPVVGPEDRTVKDRGSKDDLILLASIGDISDTVQRFEPTGSSAGPDWFPFLSSQPDKVTSPVVGTAGYTYVAWSNEARQLSGLVAIDMLRSLTMQSPDITECCVESLTIGPDATVYVMTGGDLYSYTLVTGSEGEISSITGGFLFYHSGPGLAGTPAVDADTTLYVGDAAGNVHAIASNGAVTWSFATGGPIHGSPVLAADGTLYIGSDSNFLYAIDTAGGSEKWRFDAGDDIRVAPVVGRDGTVYVGAADGGLFAVSSTTGQQRWSHTLPAAVSAPPAVSFVQVNRFATETDEEVLYVPAGSDLYAVSTAPGVSSRDRWVYQSSADEISSPALSQTGLYFTERFADGTGNLVALDPVSTALIQFSAVVQDNFLLPQEVAAILWLESEGGPLALLGDDPGDPCVGPLFQAFDCPPAEQYDKSSPLLSVLAEKDLVLGLATRTSSLDAVARGESTEGLISSDPIRFVDGEVRVLVVGGLTDPTGFAPNPDGASTELAVFLSEDLQEFATSDDMVFVLVGNLSTDAPSTTFTLIGQDASTSFEALSFGDLSTVLAVNPGAFQLTLDFGGSPGKRGLPSQLFQLDLTNEAGNLVTLLSTGFMDPAANQNGPGLTVIGTSSSGPIMVGVEDDEAVELPTQFAVQGIYPNPFNSHVTIRYAIPRHDRVRIDVYDVIGRRVATLVDAEESPGTKEVIFRRRHLASGLYFARFEFGGVVITEKLVLVR